ncbi:hypothetical protein HanOQP8_Chr04g0140121 [Helianthus annuus]|nr:hypothetical protein HanIR_Chr04g0167061 [Helianthus annuus]KAJ0756885.1 hypothetical protein HanLR1_Chr04g0132221 [Helianthus annuus]KAJ0760621.1 hypothetical protein HanOQP8_Chr04g0140121 [Helianthus annuus]
MTVSYSVKPLLYMVLSLPLFYKPNWKVFHLHKYTHPSLLEQDMQFLHLESLSVLQILLCVGIIGSSCALSDAQNSTLFLVIEIFGSALRRWDYLV